MSHPGHTTRLRLRRRMDRMPIERPCTLCGEVITYYAVQEENATTRAKPIVVEHRRIVRASETYDTGAHLQFRAFVDLDGTVWVPVVDSHELDGSCPDPPPETAEFWLDDIRREAWKADTAYERETYRRQSGW